MSTKDQRYELLVQQVSALIEGETNAVSVMANVAALLHAEMRPWWTGFYTVEGDSLLLGPFQGPVACYRIKRGHGVCGTAWAERRTIVVPDVDRFPGHIACSDRSRSEIVVPIAADDGNIVAVLDIDSTELNTFDDTDARYLARIAALLAPILLPHQDTNKAPIYNRPKTF